MAAPLAVPETCAPRGCRCRRRAGGRKAGPAVLPLGGAPRRLEASHLVRDLRVGCVLLGRLARVALSVGHSAGLCSGLRWPVCCLPLLPYQLLSLSLHREASRMPLGRELARAFRNDSAAAQELGMSSSDAGDWWNQGGVLQGQVRLTCATCQHVSATVGINRRGLQRSRCRRYPLA